MNSFNKSQKKIFPNMVTKTFMFEVYGNQFSEKNIRKILNEYNAILGFNIRNRKLNDLVVVYFVAQFGLPKNYIISEKLVIQFKKLGFVEGKFGRFIKQKC